MLQNTKNSNVILMKLDKCFWKNFSCYMGFATALGNNITGLSFSNAGFQSILGNLNSLASSVGLKRIFSLIFFRKDYLLNTSS